MFAEARQNPIIQNWLHLKLLILISRIEQYYYLKIRVALSCRKFMKRFTKSLILCTF